MIMLPVNMLIDICSVRLEALVPIAPALTPIADALRALRDKPTPTGDEADEREYIRIHRLQDALALVEVKLHAAAKASNRPRIDELSTLVVTAFKDLDVMAAGAVIERIVNA
jgi:hypothetical protein